MSKKRCIQTMGMVFIVVIFMVFFVPVDEAFHKNVFITIQFLLIGIMALVGIIRESSKYAFSLRMIHWFFCFMFMFCGGLTQFTVDKFRWGLRASFTEVETANWIILIWMTVFALGKTVFYIGSKKKNRVTNVDTKRNSIYWNQTIEFNRFGILLLIIFLCVLGIRVILQSGVTAFFMRSLYSEAVDSLSVTNISAIRTLFGSLRTGICLWTLIAGSIIYLKDKSVLNFFLFIFALFTALITVPPLGVARYVLATVYGGFLLIWSKRIKKGSLFIYLVAGGLLIVFPLLNAFRGLYTTEISLEFIQKCIGSISDNFCTADYDAYSMLIYTIRYVEKVSITWGKQLLGVALFFIPRGMWPDKPGGSGATAISLLNSSVDPNVSCPIMAEGFINFGWIGVVIFAFVLSKLSSRLDKNYWNIWKGENNIGGMVYPCLIPFFLFMCRGDLLSTFSYMIGFLVSAEIMRFVLYITNRTKLNYTKE